MSSGKQKGSGYERSVCKRLSLWITDGEHEDCLWRSAISGGRATVAHRKGKLVRQAGDITAVSPEGHVLCDIAFVECKFYRDLDFEAFFLTGKGKLSKFWKIASQEATKYGKTPLLIAKQNRTPDIVLTPPSFWKSYLRAAPLSGMSIVIKRKSTHCEVRLLDELLANKFELKIPL